MINSLREMGRRNGDLWSKVDGIQKIMKKFFKFQIEEEDMKDQITQVKCSIWLGKENQYWMRICFIVGFRWN